MAKTLNYYYASRSQSLYTTDPRAFIYIEKTDGSPYTGLAYNTSGLTCGVYHIGEAVGTVTLKNTVLSSGHISNSFVEISSTHLPGWYRFDVSSNFISYPIQDTVYSFYGAASMSICTLIVTIFEFGLRSITPYVGTVSGGYVDTVRNISNITASINNATSALATTIGTEVGETLDEKLPPSATAMQLPPEEA